MTHEEMTSKFQGLFSSPIGQEVLTEIVQMSGLMFASPDIGEKLALMEGRRLLGQAILQRSGLTYKLTTDKTQEPSND